MAGFLDTPLSDVAEALGIADATIGHGLAVIAGVVIAVYFIRQRVKMRLLQEYILNNSPGSPRLEKPKDPEE